MALTDAKASAHAYVETMWTEAIAQKFAHDLKQKGRGRLYYATSDRVQGAGCALTLRSDVPIAPSERAVYQDPRGKILAVHATWHEQQILFLITHSPHTDEKQAAFYGEVEQRLRHAYSTLPLDHKDYHPQGDLPADRLVIWAADHNFAMDTKRDAIPAHSSPNRPLARAARVELRKYLQGTVDAYRTLQPDGRAITRSTSTHAHRIDAVETSPALLGETSAFAEYHHIQPQDRIVFQTGKVRNARTAKISDHHAISLTYRTSIIPCPKRDPTFANEMTADDTGIAALKESLNQTIAAARKNNDSHAERQRQLAEAWMMQSTIHRRKTQMGIRMRVARTHRKLTKLKEYHAQAKTQAEKSRARHEIDRATVAYHDALYERQRVTQKRRGEEDMRKAYETTGDVHSKVKPQSMATPVTEMWRTTTREDGSEHVYAADTNEGILAGLNEYWTPIFQMEMDEEAAREARTPIMNSIAAHMHNRLSADEKKSIEMDAILTASNIREAIRRIKKHTTPGRDGIPIEPYAALVDSDELINSLLELYKEIELTGEMTDNMKESVTTMAFKGKGDTYKGNGTPSGNPANYRPIAVTAIEYRILATAMAQRLAEVIRRLIGHSQIGFMLDSIIDENVDLMEEVLRYANHEGSDRGGAVVVLDNAHAFDHVSWPFLWHTLQAFGLPSCFISMLQTMTRGISTRLKVNGVCGPQIEQRSGVR